MHKQNASKTYMSPNDEYSMAVFSALCAQLRTITEGIDKCQHDPSPSMDTLEQRQNELESVMKDLAHFLEDLVNHAESGKPLSRIQQSLELEGHRLLDQIALLQQHTTAAIRDVFQKHNDRPLQREEISKLLLVTARACAMQHITVEQKFFLKSEICARKSYLRRMLLQPDLHSVLTCMTKVVGGNSADDVPI